MVKPIDRKTNIKIRIIIIPNINVELSFGSFPASPIVPTPLSSLVLFELELREFN